MTQWKVRFKNPDTDEVGEGQPMNRKEAVAQMENWKQRFNDKFWLVKVDEKDEGVTL